MACPSTRTWKLMKPCDAYISARLANFGNAPIFVVLGSHRSPTSPKFSSLFFSPTGSNFHGTTVFGGKKKQKHAWNITSDNGSSRTVENCHQNSVYKIERKLGGAKQPFWKRVAFGSNKIKSILLLNLVTIVYGFVNVDAMRNALRNPVNSPMAASDIPALKAVETVMDPATFSSVRFTVSAIPFLPFVVQARDDVETRNAGIELGCWVSLGYFLEAVGLLTSDAGRASFISLFTVIMVPLLDGMLGATVPVRTWFGVLISALGVAMLECSGSPPALGDLLNLLSAMFFGIHMLRTEHISRNTKRESFLALLGYEICVVALLSTLWVILGGWLDGFQNSDHTSWPSEVSWDWMVNFPWIPALYTGLLSTGVCLWIEFAAMQNVSAIETAIIYGMEPVWGAGFAWFLLGERWGTVGWIGAALVLGGSLIVQIFGSSAFDLATKTSRREDKAELLLVQEMRKQELQRSLSASPVTVRSKERETF